MNTVGSRSVVGSQEVGEERAVPGMTDHGNLCLHLARYNLALSLAKGMRVLDAACGSGYGTQLLSLGAREVQGVDSAEVAVVYAREHFPLHSAGCYHCHDMAVLSSQVPSLGTFDLIVCFETVEHLPEVSRWEQQVYELLNPGGRIIFSVPLNERPGDNPYHLQCYTVSSARQLFGGLRRVDELIQQGLNFYPLMKGQLYAERYLAYLAVMEKPR